MAESFFATLECELIDREVFGTRHEARSKVFFFIEAFYNRRRIHSSIDYMSPEQAERGWRQRQERHERQLHEEQAASADVESDGNEQGGIKQAAGL